jgi:CDP-diacylglycerol--serine O-phosphatidyltransferase
MALKFLLPNLFTTANLWCGFLALAFCLRHEPAHACWAIIIGGFFDMADGQIARLTHTSSLFGVQYDSFSDLVTFGIAPSVFIYQWAFSSGSWIGLAVPFIFLTCGALRLSRFNLKSTEKAAGSPSLYYQGIPITIAGGLIATYGLSGMAMPILFSQFWIGLMLLLLSFTMISEVPFWSTKQIMTNRSSQLVGLGFFSGVMLTLVLKPEWVFFWFASYWVAGIFRNVVHVGLQVWGQRKTKRVKKFL